jgi:o-succinylbenzoate synthase
VIVVQASAREVRWPVSQRGAALRLSERAALIVAVRTDAGTTGLGEAAPLPGFSNDSLDDARRAARELPGFAFESPPDAARVTTSPAARFALETAFRRALGIASPPRPLRSAVVVDDEADARAAVAGGASCLKIKRLDRARAIASAAPGVPLRLDANRLWPIDEVSDRFAALDGLPIEFVEEPCPRAHELLDQGLRFPIALDESLAELAPSDLERALRSNQLAALVLKPTVLGGFMRCHELAALARRAGVAAIVSHALEGPIGFAACHELAREIACDVAVGLAPHPALEHFAEAA